MNDLLEVTRRGLYAPAGDFFVDPARPVPLAVVTHAHMDHARPGCACYLAPTGSLPFLRRRLGDEAAIVALEEGQETQLGALTLSFHPAGHVRGSAQVRIASATQVWVVSGDYKRAPDPTAAPFEPVAADVFVTEATFALPIYRWPDTAEIVAEIVAWWREAKEAGRAAVLFCYAFGKAQRLLAELGRFAGQGPTECGPFGHLPGPVWLHGAMLTLTEAYREDGVHMVDTRAVSDAPKGQDWSGALVLAPPSARATTWMRRFGRATTAFASGWMLMRGRRRWRGVDRGFVLSDHADWPELLATIADTGARRVLTTHGFAEPLARYLRETGIEASAIQTRPGDVRQADDGDAP